MPWNNESGGGWKGGGNGGGPWGQGPWGQGQGGGGGGQNPDLEEMLKRSQDRMKQVMHGGGVPGPLFFLAALAVVAVVIFYAFTFTVKADQLGVVLRFGEYNRQAEPGLNFRLPYPVEEVLLPSVTRENRIQIGFRTESQSRFSGTGPARDVPEESLMLTGDQNIVDVDFEILWRIKNAEEYLFNIQYPEQTVKDVAESAMREVVGKSNIDPLLTTERAATAESVKTLVQEILDSYKSGIVVSQVNIAKTDPPNKVIDAFRDVETARQDRDRMRNEALAYANRVVPQARGEAERILQKAEGYSQRITNEAAGKAERFKKVYEEYRKAPEVTRKRIFLETMERVFSGTDKIILDGKSGSGVVPYLPLNELTKPKTTAGGQ